ncbi:hypothetical protein D3C71_1898360 [compost metagenome]
MFKKIWQFLKILYGLFYIAAILVMGLVLSYLIIVTMGSKTLLEDAFTINFIALGIAFISIPGLIVQLISLMDINKKKTYTLTTKCPNCKHLVDFKLTED